MVTGKLLPANVVVYSNKTGLFRSFELIKNFNMKKW